MDTSYASETSSLWSDRLWSPHALPTSLNADNRPVWEPPIINYSWLIGDEYEKKREAMMKHTNNNVARTTAVMDVDTEWEILDAYRSWLLDNISESEDAEGCRFFDGLLEEVRRDWKEVIDEWAEHDGGINYEPNGDGSYDVRVNCGVNLSPAEETEKEDEETELEEGSEHPHEHNESDTVLLDHHGECHRTHHRISSESDDEEELAWLAFIDASASVPRALPSTSQKIPSFESVPLAMRLMSLGSSVDREYDTSQHGRVVSATEDDLG